MPIKPEAACTEFGSWGPWCPHLPTAGRCGLWGTYRKAGRRIHWDLSKLEGRLTAYELGNSCVSVGYMRLSTSCHVGLMILILVAASAAQSRAYTEEELVRYAKSIDVHKLDSSLPSQTLEDWLLHGPAQIDELYWSINTSCDLKDPEPDGDGELPLCVRIGFRRGSNSGFGRVKVGTLKSGIKGGPEFQSLSVLLPISVGDYDRLSEFPRYLDGIPQFGTICVLPFSSKLKRKISSPGNYNPATLKLRIDQQQALSWPREQPVKIEHLSLSWSDEHSVVIISDNKRIQTLRFNFVLDYEDDKVCLAFDADQLANIGKNKRDSWCRCQ